MYVSVQLTLGWNIIIRTPMCNIWKNIQLRQKSAKLGHQHEKSIASQPLVCVQFWVPSPLDYVQSSLSYWNQTKLKWGWGGVVAVHGVGDLSQTVCKKGNCINLIEELLRMHASRFYASVLLVLLPSAVFLALITCPPPSSPKGMNPDIAATLQPPSVLALSWCSRAHLLEGRKGQWRWTVNRLHPVPQRRIK